MFDFTEGICNKSEALDPLRVPFAVPSQTKRLKKMTAVKFVINVHMKSQRKNNYGQARKRQTLQRDK